MRAAAVQAPGSMLGKENGATLSASASQNPARKRSLRNGVSVMRGALDSQRGTCTEAFHA